MEKGRGVAVCSSLYRRLRIGEGPWRSVFRNVEERSCKGRRGGEEDSGVCRILLRDLNRRRKCRRNRDSFPAQRREGGKRRLSQFEHQCVAGGGRAKACGGESY